MRSLICFCAVVIASSVSLAQWQQQPQEDRRVEPIYPRNEPYQFQSRYSNYDPYQFNWYSGRWDYAPVPYDNDGSAYRFNWGNGKWDYAPLPSPPRNTVPTPAPVGPSNAIPHDVRPPADAGLTPPGDYNRNSPLLPARPTTRPDDTELWMHRPATQPTTAPSAGAPPAARVIKFEGKLTGMRALNLRGDSGPHLLIRLLADNGARASVDIDDRLDLDELKLAPGSSTPITVHGALGQVDGCPVIFADELTAGDHTVKMERGRGR